MTAYKPWWEKSDVVLFYYRYNFPIRSKEDVAETLQQLFETDELARLIPTQYEMIAQQWFEAPEVFRPVGKRPWLQDRYVDRMRRDGEIFFAGLAEYDELTDQPTSVSPANYPAIVAAMEMVVRALRAEDEDSLYAKGVKPLGGERQELHTLVNQIGLCQRLERSLATFDDWTSLPDQ